MSFSVALLCLLSFAQNSSDEAKGLAALDQKDYQTAEQIFSRLAAADPHDYAARFNLALAETALGKDAEAIERFRQTLELKPGLYEAQLNLGMLYLRNRRPADAAPLLSAAAASKPGDARVERYLGDSLLATGRLAEATDAYGKVLAADPKSAPAELGLGQALLRQSRIDEALPHLRKAAALDPSLRSFLLEAATSLEKANRTDEAAGLLMEFQGDAGAQEELGRIYLGQNKLADAIAAFSRAVALSPTSANQLALASAYLKNNQPDLATPILEKAVNDRPDDYDLHIVVGRLHRDRRDFRAAAEQFLIASRLKPDSVEPLNEAIGVLVLAEQYETALALLDKVHAMRADTPGNLYYRALLLDKLHQPKPALVAYRQFLANSGGKYPDQEFIARQRARVLEKAAGK